MRKSKVRAQKRVAMKLPGGLWGKQQMGDEEFLFVFKDDKTSHCAVIFPAESPDSMQYVLGPWWDARDMGKGVYTVSAHICASPSVPDVDVMGNIAHAISGAFVAGMLYERKRAKNPNKLPQLAKSGSFEDFFQ